MTRESPVWVVAQSGSTSKRAMAESAMDAKQAKSRTSKKREGLSCLDAAKVLQAAGEPMITKAMVEAKAAKGYWTSDAPTPAATLYSALLRELLPRATTPALPRSSAACSPWRRERRLWHDLSTSAHLFIGTPGALERVV